MFLLGRTIEEVLMAKDTVIFLLQHLVFITNLEKSVLIPTQNIEILGLTVDSIRMTVSHWISNPGIPCSKPLGDSKFDSAFHPCEVDKMSTRNIWELGGKK